MTTADLPSESSLSTASLEAWAERYLLTEALEDKLSPAPPPEAFAADTARFVAPARPGRAAELRAAAKAKKTPGSNALKEASRRAQVLHTFFHHELQAAELFAWAILAYPDADRSFRRGLARLLLDEARHMRLYAARIRDLGYDIGSFPVRDWFWDRVPAAPTPLSFVATLGLGFEGGNLDHAARFAERFAAAGDEESAALQRRVAEEEEPHVRFALRWFERFSGSISYETFAESLPPPLSPGLMRGKSMAREARVRAGFPPAFLDCLEQCPLVSPGSLTSTPTASSLGPAPSRPPRRAAPAWWSSCRACAGSSAKTTSSSRAPPWMPSSASSATPSVPPRARSESSRPSAPRSRRSPRWMCSAGQTIAASPPSSAPPWRARWRSAARAISARVCGGVRRMATGC